MPTATCLDCEATIDLDEDVIKGEIVECPDCGSEFEIVSIGRSVELASAEIEGEDWGE